MKRFLALILSLLMIFSLAACNSSDDTDTNENDAEANEKLPETEDEILEYVLNALKATVKYEGDISLTATSSVTSTQATGATTQEEKDVESYLVAFDSVNKVRYWEDINDSSRYGKTESLNKTFVVDGVLYGMEKVNSSGSTEESYFRIHDAAKDKYQVSDHKDYLEGIAEMYSGIDLAINMDEINSAFDTALAPILKSVYSLDDDAPALVKEISAEVKNGAPTLTIGFDFSVLAELAGIKGGVDLTMSTVIAAKNNKISEFSMTFEVEQSSSMGETLIQSYKQTSSHSMSIEYAFAKDKYDALTVNLPENADDIHIQGAPATEYSDVVTNIFVNGVKIDSALYDNVDTPQGALEAIISSVMNDVSKLSVRIYKDEAMTQEITMDSVTKDDIMTLENVYLNVTPNDCALVIAKYSEKDAYSKPYKIVAPFLSMLGFNSSNAWSQPIACPANGEYELDSKSVSNEYCEIWVNGVKQDPKKNAITVDNGKTYIVEYVTIVSENNM